MFSSTKIAILILSLAIKTINAHFTPCTVPFLLATIEKKLSKCKRLTTLNAELAWKIDEKNEQEIEILFGTRLYDGLEWVAWGVNPGKLAQMVGTRAIIGIKHQNGSHVADTYNITRDTKMGCKLLPRKFNELEKNEVIFGNISMEYVSQMDYHTIKGRIVLPMGYNISRLNHVWQVGYLGSDAMPLSHPAILQNVDSSETIDLRSGWPIRHVGLHTRYFRTVHGILNIVGWGTILPVGVIIARYFKYPLECGKWWFRLHVVSQVVGYSIGTAGWIIGLVLGAKSKFYFFRTHRLYGIVIFALTTLQMLALRLRPEKNDEYRKYWNMYHHFLGYGLIALISINIFNGIDILKPDYTWKWAYTGILVAFAAIVAALEIYTWTKFTSTKPLREVSPTTGLPMPPPTPRP